MRTELQTILKSTIKKEMEKQHTHKVINSKSKSFKEGADETLRYIFKVMT